MPAAAVEGQHQLTSQPLPERMTADERIELRDEFCVTAERELRVDALLEADEVLLAEPGLLEPGERLLELGERRAAPQPERTPQRGRGLLRSDRLRAPRVPWHGAFKGTQVERMAVEVEAVPRRTCLDQPLRNLLAEQRDEDLHHLRRARRHLLAPEVVDDPGHRDHAVRMKQQQRQQGLLLAARQVDGPVSSIASSGPRIRNSTFLPDDYRRFAQRGLRGGRSAGCSRRSVPLRLRREAAPAFGRTLQLVLTAPLELYARTDDDVLGHRRCTLLRSKPRFARQGPLTDANHRHPLQPHSLPEEARATT